MKSQRQTNLENRLIRPFAAITVAALGTLGVMHERSTNEKANEIPGITQIADNPHENYTVQEGDNPITVAYKFGQGPDSKLVRVVGEQEQNGYLQTGQNVMIPEDETKHNPSGPKK